AAERALKGTRPRHRRAVGFVAPPASPPRRPPGLGPVGRRLWREAWRAGHWLTDLDRLAVEVAARTADELARLEAAIAAAGPLAPGSKGQPVRSPLLAARDAAADRLRAYLGDLGLTPAGRRRLGIETKKPAPVVDAAEVFLGRLSAGRETDTERSEP
ncbi:MAG TPA: P27 family phage terminase small subunit, partial [Candidatus Binatia bacterium]|nr:P27 family phage terminase small subunit [Candidatus Binatia bacterium]